MVFFLLDGGILNMEGLELQLKEMIIEKYGSLSKFCEKIGMPWTTLNSILNRGVSKSNITNILKITKELNVDTELLASGTIIEFNDARNSRLLAYYEKLNSCNRNKLLKYAEGLYDVQSSELELNAAHKRTDIDIPEGIDTSENDIMDNENF
jgi:hypothetical protein